MNSIPFQLTTILAIASLILGLPTDKNSGFESAAAGTIKQQFIIKSGFTPQQWDLISYAVVIDDEQIVFAKVQYDQSGFLILRAQMPERILQGYKGGASLASPLEYFESGTYENMAVVYVEPKLLDPITFPPSPPTTTKAPLPQASQNMNFENCISGVIKTKFQEKTSLTPVQWTLVSYTQVTSDPDCFFAKIQYGPSSYVHLRIRLPGILEGYKLRQSKNDPLEYFESGTME